MRVQEIILEEYVDLFNGYPVFKDPTTEEIRKFYTTHQSIRFVAYSGEFFIFSGELLHYDFLLDYLNIPFRVVKSNDTRKFFIGEADPTPEGGLEFVHSSQKINFANGLSKHPYILKYFDH